MMTRRQFIELNRDSILRLAAAQGARNVRLFGSQQRGDASEASDIDLVVELEPGRSLIDLGRLKVDLEELLGCPVDVTTESGLHWYIRDRVLQEAVPLSDLP